VRGRRRRVGKEDDEEREDSGRLLWAPPRWGSGRQGCRRVQPLAGRECMQEQRRWRRRLWWSRPLRPFKISGLPLRDFFAGGVCGLVGRRCHFHP
jgi:hypothetical protein